MTWTYDSPQASDKDTVRFLVQDTNTNEQLASDEEIEWALAEHGNIVRAAAAEVAEAIGRHFARQATITDAGFRVDYSKRAEMYFAIAKDLRQRFQAVSPFAGGISITDKDSREEDTDRVRPAFTRDQFAYPGTELSRTDTDEES